VGRLIGVKWRAAVHDPTAPPYLPAGAGRTGGSRGLRACLGIKVLTRLAEMAPVADSGGAHES